MLQIETEQKENLKLTTQKKTFNLRMFLLQKKKKRWWEKSPPRSRQSLEHDSHANSAVSLGSSCGHLDQASRCLIPAQGREGLPPTSSTRCERRVKLLKAQLADRGLLQKQCYLMGLAASDRSSSVYSHMFCPPVGKPFVSLCKHSCHCLGEGTEKRYRKDHAPAATARHFPPLL